LIKISKSTEIELFKAVNFLVNSELKFSLNFVLFYFLFYFISFSFSFFFFFFLFFFQFLRNHLTRTFSLSFPSLLSFPLERDLSQCLRTREPQELQEEPMWHRTCSSSSLSCWVKTLIVTLQWLALVGVVNDGLTSSPSSSVSFFFLLLLFFFFSFLSFLFFFLSFFLFLILFLFLLLFLLLPFLFSGDSAVGKSSLVLRFVKGQFHEYQESTIGGIHFSVSVSFFFPS